jgi:hypothetical protein
MANDNSRSYPKGIKEIRYPSESIIQRFTSKDYTGTITLNNETGEFVFDPPLSDSSSSGTSFTVSKASHGFSVLDPLYHDGSDFVLANASDSDTLGLWIVTSVTSDDTFTAAQSGRFEIEDHGLATGEYYYVGTTDGSITATEPSQYSNPLIYVESDTYIHVLPFRPASTDATTGGGSGDVSSVFGRTGDVVAVTGDYTAEQVGLGNVLNLEQALASDLGNANGIATLGSDGKVPDDQLPSSVSGGLDVIGFWDADTNTPDISSLTLTTGECYQVSVAGSTELNSISSWGLYDLAVWDSTVTGNWFKISSSSTITSVNDMTGAVVLDTDDIDEGDTNLYYTDDRVSANSDVVANIAKVSADGSISTHSDVDTESVGPATGQCLAWDGSNWIPSTISGTLPDGLSGDILYNDGSGWLSLEIGSVDQILTSDGSGISWATRNSYYDLAIAISDETTDLTTDNNADILITRDQTVSSFIASVNTAPSGSSIIVDVQNNGTSIATLTIPSGSTYIETTDISDTSLSEFDVLTFDTTQIGASTAGNGLKIYAKTIL